jgi:hypothetical protein
MKTLSILIGGIGLLCLATTEGHAIAAGRESLWPIVTECSGSCDHMLVGDKARHRVSRRPTQTPNELRSLAYTSHRLEFCRIAQEAPRARGQTTAGMKSLTTCD